MVIENNYVTFIYAFERTGGVGIFKDHIIFPSIFLAKQILLLVPLFLMSFFLIKNFRFNISFKKEKTIFLLFVVIFPIILVFLTSLILGAKIRTMWMTPFYLFIGVFLVQAFKEKIITKKFEKFFTVFTFFFILSPLVYFGISATNENKRTSYPGKRNFQTSRKQVE